MRKKTLLTATAVALVAMTIPVESQWLCGVGLRSASAQEEDPEITAEAKKHYKLGQDAYAEAKRIERRTGIPADSVLANPIEAKREAAVGSIDFGALAKTAPATAALLADVERAKVSHDDLDNLQGAETTLKAWKGPTPSFSSVASGFAEALKFKPLVAGMRLWMNDLMFGAGTTPEGDVSTPGTRCGPVACGGTGESPTAGTWSTPVAS